MAFVEDVEKTVSTYLSSDYEIRETTGIPSVEAVPFGNVVFKTQICVLYADIRKSTELLQLNGEETAGKLHKSFIYAVASVIRLRGGHIRSLNGDSILAFWPAQYKLDICTCVRAAMTAKWMVDVQLRSHFEKLFVPDFGIGIDWGSVYVARAGLPRDSNNNDLIFMGECVNFAVRIGEQAHAPEHVEISYRTFENLDEDQALIKGKIQNQEVDVWKDGRIKLKDKVIPTKLTTWYVPM
jgi:adenylate cyclase